jgi:hypothetical protein
MRHNINEEDVLVKPEWAWFLGYFWADGSFYSKRGSWALELKSEDFDEIWHILQSLGFNSFCSRTRQDKYNQKSIKSSKLANFYREFDFDKKSSIPPVKLWNIFSNLQKTLFLRGLFEGDGCFTGDIKNSRITMNGSKNYNWDFLLDFFQENSIEKPCIERKTRIQKNKKRGYSILTWCRKTEKEKIVKLLYSDNIDICLKRKFLKAKQITAV